MSRIEDLNSALLVAAQNLAAAAIDRGGTAEAERVGAASDRGGRLQVSIELPGLAITVALIDQGEARVIYSAALQPADATPLRALSSRLN